MNIPDYDVGNLDINPVIIAALKRANLSNQKKLLSLSVPDIERLSGLSTNQIVSLKNNLATKFVPLQRATALDILRRRAHKSLLHWTLSVACPVIDDTLRGGIRSGLLTEIAGESASGKTQLCLQLCLSAQLSNKGAVYICTEDVFPSKRLQQMIQFHARKTGRSNLGNGIFIEHVSDFDTLDFCVTKRLPTLLNRGDARVVIIDSVAALFRCHYDAFQTIQRAEHLIQFAAALKSFSSEHNIPIICVNQVTSNIQSTSTFGSAESLIPSLGITWANQIHCRIMMSKPSFLSQQTQNFKENFHKTNQTDSVDPTIRTLKVVFAPHIPASKMSVYIDNAGIHGIRGEND